MGFNLKEKLQNVSRKNVAIVTIILLVLTICASAGYEYYHYKQLEAQKQELFEKLTASANQTGEPQKPSEYKIGIEYNKAMKSKKPVLVLFYADWCGPCKKISPILKELAGEYKNDIIIYKINVDNEKELAAAFGIQSIPTLLFIPAKGKPQLAQGALSKEQFVEQINGFLLGKK